MKKFFTLIAAVAMAASVNAQTTSTEWNFSNWEAKEYTETLTKDGLTLVVGSDSKGKLCSFTVDVSNKTIDDVKYTQRLKTGGKGDFDKDGNPLLRVLKFNVSGPSDIYVVAATSNKTDPKVLTIDVLETGAEKATNVGTINYAANEQKAETVKYTGAGGVIYMYPNGGLNYYDIKVTPSTSTGITSIEASASVKSNAIYNLAGQQVSSSYKGIVIKNGKKVLNNK